MNRKYESVVKDIKNDDHMGNLGINEAIIMK
jgi:hypothetical protein